MNQNKNKSLYTAKIIDHYKHPRNFGQMKGAHLKAELVNRYCGDEVTVYIKLKKGKIDAISFEGAGCAISMASISILTEQLLGKKIKEVEALKEDLVFKNLGLRKDSGRRKCALLGFNAIKKALKQVYKKEDLCKELQKIKERK